MKKFLTVLLGILLCFACFAGCAESETPGGGQQGETPGGSQGELPGGGNEEPAEPDWMEDGTMKILMFGNSYTDDTSEHMWHILNSLGVKTEIYRIAGGTYDLERHLDQLENETPTDASSTFHNVNGTWVQDRNVTHKQLIEMTDWDFITLQHQSALSGRPEKFGFMDPLMAALGSVLGEKKTQIVWLLSWAYPQSSKNQNFFTYFNGDQETMYQALVNTCRDEVLPFGLGVDPVGTAIQNARTSFLGDTLCRDDIHLTFGLGRYIAGLTTVAALSGLKLREDVYKPSSVTDDERLVAIESAENAVKSPFAVTESLYQE